MSVYKIRHLINQHEFWQGDRHKDIIKIIFYPDATISLRRIVSPVKSYNFLAKYRIRERQGAFDYRQISMHERYDIQNVNKDVSISVMRTISAPSLMYPTKRKR